MAKKLRPVGDILMDLEVVLMELSSHGLQWGDVFGLIHKYLMVHLPQDQEEYEDGSHPEFYYGPRREK
jgi:hypothetical protein